MKKVITLLLVVMLVVSMATTAFAAKAGETVTVEFKTSGNPGFGSYNATISYDTSALELVEVKEGSLTSGKGMFSYGNKAAFMALNDVTGDGVLFVATFKVKDAATKGKSYDVTAALVAGSASNTAGEAVSFSIKGGSVKVDECDHSWGAWTETKAATCAAEGEESRTCSACGKTETRAIAKLTTHTWGEWAETKAPTCAAEGEETRTCSVCQKTETRAIAKVAHTWGEWVETKAPTCAAKGEETRTCSACGETETREVAKLAHSWGDAEKKNKTHHTYTCTVCGDTKDEPHHFENNGVCTECGYKKTTSTGGGKDNVPDTGDITPMITMGAVAMVSVLAAAVYVTKRRITK